MFRFISFFSFFCTLFGSSSSDLELPVFFLNHPEDSVLTMGCPGAQADMAVAWDRGSEPIYRSKHLSGGNLGPQSSRLQIDTGHHLLFKPAQTEDSGSAAVPNLHLETFNFIV